MSHSPTRLAPQHPGDDEPYAGDLFLARLSKKAVALDGLEGNGIFEDPRENSDADGQNLWVAGSVTLIQTYAIARPYKPFLTFEQHSRIHAHAATSGWDDRLLSRDRYADIARLVEEWESTSPDQRPDRFPEGGPDLLCYGVSIIQTWRVHGHAGDPYSPPEHYCGDAVRGGTRSGLPVRVRNLRSLDEAWVYARHAASSIDPTDLDSIGLVEAMSRF